MTTRGAPLRAAARASFRQLLAVRPELTEAFGEEALEGVLASFIASPRAEALGKNPSPRQIRIATCVFLVERAASVNAAGPR